MLQIPAPPVSDAETAKDFLIRRNGCVVFVPMARESLPAESFKLVSALRARSSCHARNIFLAAGAVGCGVANVRQETVTIIVVFSREHQARDRINGLIKASPQILLSNV